MYSCVGAVAVMDKYGVVFFFKQKTAYEMRISDWSSDVCSSDLRRPTNPERPRTAPGLPRRLRLLAMTNLTGRTSLGPARVDRGFHRQPDAQRKIGRASCRESVCQYV